MRLPLKGATERETNVLKNRKLKLSVLRLSFSERLIGQDCGVFYIKTYLRCKLWTQGNHFLFSSRVFLIHSSSSTTYCNLFQCHRGGVEPILGMSSGEGGEQSGQLDSPLVWSSADQVTSGLPGEKNHSVLMINHSRKLRRKSQKEEEEENLKPYKYSLRYTHTVHPNKVILWPHVNNEGQQ